MLKIAGINGFGRFGLHLLKYWLDRSKEANFKIAYINDDHLTLDQAYQMLLKDRYVHFNKYKIQIIDKKLFILEPNGTKHEIVYTHSAKESISWLGQPDILFECSGKSTVSSSNLCYLIDRTKTVLISATSWDCDKTLVYGFNHQDYDPSKHKIISYGSCTVNAYVPLAEYIHQKYEISDSDVNVVHNIQEYRLHENQTLNRKFCTLEESGPKLLPFLQNNNFIVNYTVVPHTGVSLIDFRFRTKTPIDRQAFLLDLEHTCSEKNLKGLYGFDEVDIGPEGYNCTTFSTVWIKENIKLVGGSFYLQGYFDTENSVNRYFDLAHYILAKD
jgi:glyceraldehyde 3-phosphate dehydrogenase